MKHFLLIILLSALSQTSATSAVQTTCPYVGGNGVLKARTLWMHWQPYAMWDDRVLCIQGQNKNGNSGYVNLDSLYEAQTNEDADKLVQLQGVHANTTAVEYNKIVTDSFEDILIYPNPASNYITISNYLEIGTFELYNALGQIILSHSLNSQEYQKIVLPKLSNGMYSYKILGKNRTHYGKLNIQQNE